MKKWTTTVVTGLAALLLIDAAPALAQRPTAAARTFINANVGLQATSRTEDATVTFPLNDESAEFRSATEVGSGPFFDVSVGRRAGWYNMVLVGGFSYFGTNGDAAGTAFIPHPDFFDDPLVVPISGQDLSRSELGFHFSAMFVRPLGDKLDIALSLGPSVYRVSQEFLSGTVPENTQDLTETIDEQSGFGIGLSVGVDTAYLITPQMGIGVLLRYSWAPVDLDAGSMTAGGFQIGAGIRIRLQ